jgi:hypothetical protein
MEDQTQNAKTCRMCAETINVAARLCPCCRTDQRKSAVTLMLVVPWLGWLLMLLMGLGVVSLASRMLDPGRDFAPFRDRFEVVSSSMQFSKNEKGQYVTTVGTVRNNSDFAWEDVQMEVRYFDRENKLVDVGAHRFSDVALQPHSESAFRVRVLADQPETDYASHKVYVRSAKDIKRWPGFY